MVCDAEFCGIVTSPQPNVSSMITGMSGRIVRHLVVWSSAAAPAAVLALWATSYHRFVVFSNEGRIDV
jgi:hypothetical protein